MAVLGRSVVCRSAWLVLVFLASAGCRMGPDQWGPFRGQIVDAETGAPIPGAHFMVMWERDHPNPVHWTQSFYDAQEAVTDADGRFEIPRQRRFFTLLVNPPRFDAFAPGYVAESSEVTPRSGLPYVDATVLKMRRPQSQKELCESRPREPGAPTAKVPDYMRAVQQYNLVLDCLE
jgi:hypothetical protein